MAVAVEVRVVVEVGVDGVLGPHELVKVVARQLAAHAQVNLSVLERAVKLSISIHISGRFKVFIVTREAFDMLAFHGLAMNGGMTSIRYVGGGRHSLFESRHVGFSGGGTVGVHFHALTGCVVDFDVFLEIRHGHIQRAFKPVEIAGLVEAVFSRVLAPVIIAGILHPCGITLWGAVEDKLVGTEHQGVGRQTGRYIGLGCLQCGHVVAYLQCIGGVRVFAVSRVLPAYSLTVADPHGVIPDKTKAGGIIVGKRVNEHTYTELIGGQSFLEQRNLRRNGGAAAVRGADAGCGVYLRRTSDTERTVGLEFTGKRHQALGLHFQ